MDVLLKFDFRFRKYLYLIRKPLYRENVILFLCKIATLNKN